MITLRIAAAAIQIGQITYALSPPARHHTIMWWLAGFGPNTKPHGGPIIYDRMPSGEEQGFITSDGMFVNRKTARKIAVAANQLIPRAMDLEELYSEDVW